MKRSFVVFGLMALALSACSYDTNSDNVCGAGISSDKLGTRDCECSASNVKFCDSFSNSSLQNGTWTCNTSGPINRCEVECDQGYTPDDSKKMCTQGCSDDNQCAKVEGALSMRCSNSKCWVNECKSGFNPKKNQGDVLPSACEQKNGGNETHKESCITVNDCTPGYGIEAYRCISNKCEIQGCVYPAIPKMEGQSIVECALEPRDCSETGSCDTYEGEVGVNCERGKCVVSGCDSAYLAYSSSEGFIFACEKVCAHGEFCDPNKGCEYPYDNNDGYFECVNCAIGDMVAACGSPELHREWDETYWTNGCRCVSVCAGNYISGGGGEESDCICDGYEIDELCKSVDETIKYEVEQIYNISNAVELNLESAELEGVCTTFSDNVDSLLNGRNLEILNDLKNKITNYNDGQAVCYDGAIPSNAPECEMMNRIQSVHNACYGAIKCDEGVEVSRCEALNKLSSYLKGICNVFYGNDVDDSNNMECLFFKK